MSELSEAVEMAADAKFDEIHKALCDERLIDPDADSDRLVEFIAAREATAARAVVVAVEATKREVVSHVYDAGVRAAIEAARASTSEGEGT